MRSLVNPKHALKYARILLNSAKPRFKGFSPNLYKGKAPGARLPTAKTSLKLFCSQDS